MSTDADSGNLIVGVLGLVVSIGTYILGRRQGAAHEREAREREITHHQSDQEQRTRLEAERASREAVERVTQAYVKLVQTAQSGGIYAMASAGVATLSTDAEAREALRLMQLHTGVDPLGKQRSVLEGVNLVSFFRFAQSRQLRFERVAPADIIKQMRAAGIDPAAPV